MEPTRKYTNPRQGSTHFQPSYPPGLIRGSRTRYNVREHLLPCIIEDRVDEREGAQGSLGKLYHQRKLMLDPRFGKQLPSDIPDTTRMVKVYNTKIVLFNNHGDGDNPELTIRVAWEIFALKCTAALEKWEYRVVPGFEADFEDGEIVDAEVYIYFNTRGGRPLRDVLRDPKVKGTRLDYSRMSPNERLELLRKCGDALAWKMASYSSLNPGVYAAALDLGNVYFHFDARGDVIAELPEWSYTKYVAGFDSDWTLATGHGAFCNPVDTNPSIIPDEVQMIFRHARCLVYQPHGGLEFSWSRPYERQISRYK